MVRRVSSRGGQGPPGAGHRRRSSGLGQQVQRRSGSLGYGPDPRMSNASWRSTRERVVVVDEKGVRREYNR